MVGADPDVRGKLGDIKKKESALVRLLETGSPKKPARNSYRRSPASADGLPLLEGARGLRLRMPMMMP